MEHQAMKYKSNICNPFRNLSKLQWLKKDNHCLSTQTILCESARPKVQDSFSSSENEWDLWLWIGRDRGVILKVSIEFSDYVYIKNLYI